jgi:putative membrane protein
MKTLRYVFWALVVLCLVLVGLANHGFVTVRAMPEWLGGLLNISPDVTLPLFMVIFIAVGGGLLIGLLWEWIREYRERAENRARAREIEKLRTEVAKLRASTGSRKGGDDVIAMLDSPTRKSA